MTTINDFATSYMNQSLPFGGVKDSGFDRFAGVEGLRGVCTVKAVCQDKCISSLWCIELCCSDGFENHHFFNPTADLHLGRKTSVRKHTFHRVRLQCCMSCVRY